MCRGTNLFEDKMRERRFRLIKNNKIVGHEKHKVLTDPMTNKKNVYIYHSRTGHELSWHEITMCPKEEIIQYLKAKFKKDMTLNNFEEWHIDHIIPESKFCFSPEYIAHDDKDQYTELKDRNGKEICEGDIVRINNNIDCIEFSDGCFLLKNETGYEKLLYVWKEEIEIIGNKYENPELKNEEVE